tara:strand:+ start:76 stop:387 length:312 start_codon:yes stop_codon:yes gene_type:complete
MKHSFKIERNCGHENSFGAVGERKTVTLRVHVSVSDNNPTRGSFELYDIVTGGDQFYSEGGLWFDEDNSLTDYDGIFCLPDFIVDCLEKQFQKDVTEMRRSLS